MTKLYTNTRNLVFDKLKVINQTADFLTNPTVLEGFLVHHVKDLLKGEKGKNFPALTVEYFKDNNIQNQGSLDNKCNRFLHIFGAVNADCPDEVNQKLDDLLFDVKSALCNTDRNLTLSEVEYLLPENNEAYAMFRILVNVSVTEKIGTNQ